MIKALAWVICNYFQQLSKMYPTLAHLRCEVLFVLGSVHFLSDKITILFILCYLRPKTYEFINFYEFIVDLHAALILSSH